MRRLLRRIKLQHERIVQRLDNTGKQRHTYGHRIADSPDFFYTDIAGMVFDQADIRKICISIFCEITLSQALDFTQSANGVARVHAIGIEDWLMSVFPEAILA